MCYSFCSTIIVYITRNDITRIYLMILKAENKRLRSKAVDDLIHVTTTLDGVKHVATPLDDVIHVGTTLDDEMHISTTLDGTDVLRMSYT